MEIVLKTTHIERNGSWINKAREVKKVQQLRKQYEAMEKDLLKELKILSEGVNSRGGGFAYTCSMRAGSVDYTAIPQLRGIDLELYRKEGVEVWKLEMEVQ